MLSLQRAGLVDSGFGSGGVRHARAPSFTLWTVHPPAAVVKRRPVANGFANEPIIIGCHRLSWRAGHGAEYRYEVLLELTLLHRL